MPKEAAIPAGAGVRDRIIAVLRSGPSSISAIARAVSEGRTHPIHRLTIAGYLAAMAEAGILKELERPPSKLYLLQEPEAHRSLHQRVVRVVHSLDAPDHAGLAVAVLQHVLGRPLFAAELRHAGLGSSALHLPRIVVPDEERRGYRRNLQRHPGLRIEIPHRDPLLGHEEGSRMLQHPLIDEVVRRVLLTATQAEHLRAGGPPPQQASLALEGR